MLLLEKYLEAIEVTNIKTSEEALNLMLLVNEENEKLLNNYAAIASQVAELFVENYYAYPIYEQLAPNVTKEDIEKLEAIINTTELPKKGKGWLVSDLNRADAILDVLLDIRQLHEAANRNTAKDRQLITNMLKYIATGYNEQLFEKYIDQLKIQNIQSVDELNRLIQFVNTNTSQQANQQSDIPPSLYTLNETYDSLVESYTLKN